MIISPKVRGFICTAAHPEGCRASVLQQIQYVKDQGAFAGPKRVLVIGASTGYGLASRIVSAFGAGAKTLGVFFEKPASGKRTASPGWYNTVAFEKQAQVDGLYAKSLNGDAFSNEMKQQVCETIAKDLGQVDLVIYSLAAPMRKDPDSGEVARSALKTVDQTYHSKTVNTMTREISEVTVGPATPEEIASTIKVMGGDDWARWVTQLQEKNLLADGAMTLAYSYLGPELTYPIYKDGSIGMAKKDLYATADRLNEKLQTINGHAYVSINKAVVTQASAAIPVVPLYISILFKVMKEKGLHEGCIEQIERLFQQRLYTGGQVPVDEQRLIRVDDWEMRDDVQSEVAKIWQQVTSDNIDQLSDIQDYVDEFYHLFGFRFPAVNYEVEVDPSVEIPSIVVEET